MMKQINWWKTKFGDNEINEVARSIKNENISQGKVTEEFEKAIQKKLKIAYVVATTSGSTAMLMSLIVAGVKQGDEVIVPNRTWIATAHAPYILGAKVILVDVKQEKPIMDIVEIGGKITKKTKAIMPVHLNGRSVDIKYINEIAEKHNLIVIEDSAQAFCSQNEYGYLGTLSFAGCFSLSVAKLISTGQGGFIATKDSEVYDKLKLIRTHGVKDLINSSYSCFGFNFRFNDILASMGLAQMQKIDERIGHLISIYKMYEEAIQEISCLKLIPVDITNGEIPLYIEVLTEKRDELMKFLKLNGIRTRPFYPNINRAEYLNIKGNFPNSELFEEYGLFLPSGMQDLEDIDYVIETLRKFK